MKQHLTHFIGIVILSLIAVSITFAGGYQINEQDARAVGMGGAFVARASDPSAIYYNPAGLTSQNGINILAGVDFIIPSTSFTSTSTSITSSATTKISTNSQVFTPINVYGTYQIEDDIVVGLGVYNPFGLGTDWPNSSDWNAVYGSLYALKTTVSTWLFNPSVGYKIDNDLSVGLGVSYVYGSADVTNARMTLNGTGSGFSVNIGAIYKIMPELSVGASYRSETDIKFSGTGTVPAYGLSGSGNATLPMPGNLQVGVSYDVMPELTLEADIQYVWWSTYKNLDINLPAPVGTITEPKDWNDEPIIRVGAEYKYDADLTLRGGLIMDLTPQGLHVVEPMLPDADRFDISIGAGYKIDNNWHVDAAYMLVLFNDRTVGTTNIYLTPGIYSSVADVVTVNVGYTF